MYIQKEWLIPYAASLTGVPEKDIRRAWSKSVKDKKVCVINVPGDLPPMKKCPVCEYNMLKDSDECKICAVNEGSR